jgi:hypothetical protein
MVWVYINGEAIALRQSPTDLVRAELPKRIRHRLKLSVEHDPYDLRTDVVVDIKGERYASGPCEVVWQGGGRVRIILPDWFISHLCTIPLEPE